MDKRPVPNGEHAAPAPERPVTEASSAPAKCPRKDAPAEPEATLWTRRDWMTRSGWGLLVASGAIGTGAAVRLLYPRVRFEPPTTVVLGKPDDYAVGEVSERFKKSHGVVLVREAAGFYALRAVCTHLGCVPNWSAPQQTFRCPCHGSGFRRNGTNFEGPAPRPLERLAIALDDDGRIVVDTAIRLRGERGEWGRDEAYLPYAAGSAREPA